MSKTPTHPVPGVLLEKIAQHNIEGIGIEALAQQLGGEWSRRTLQRRLAGLVEQGLLRRLGEGRGMRYRHVVSLALSGEVESQGSAVFKTYVPLSDEARAIREHVGQPRALRVPVNYQNAFLERYTPNRTPYLPPDLCDQLHSMGRSPAEKMPAGTFARDVLQRLLIDLSWASSKLEGNTHSLLDTERLIEFGEAAEGKNALETQMILNHKNAIQYLVNGAGQIEISTRILTDLHALLSDGLMENPMDSGRVRTHAVGIEDSVYLPPPWTQQQLEEMLNIIIQMAAEIAEPFEQAFFLMVHLPYLQPFADVNKRVSRLAANIPFIRHNLCPLTFIDVPQALYVQATLAVYELNRIELLRDVFVWAYGRSCQQYVAVQQNLVQPDMFRLRHRHRLGEVVASVVRGLIAVSDQTLREQAPPELSDADKNRFVTLVWAELKTLHAGNAIRFGLRPLELAAWQEQERG
jgi:fido (protein-threonine AMPylation protein)